MVIDYITRYLAYDRYFFWQGILRRKIPCATLQTLKYELRESHAIEQLIHDQEIEMRTAQFAKINPVVQFSLASVLTVALFLGMLSTVDYSMNGFNDWVAMPQRHMVASQQVADWNDSENCVKQKAVRDV
ncbi:hypothetical protein HNQ59_000449 [Chitinivorax tropicus]|uniref:Uncharacterized protein n=1 Tax=Chitinivorax tropicus TaxID=714531 RepID=A0A840MK28_9PROT|nr:hypothetical protein [Chitinivorax tropicus]MBB5017187.1 hypothetical protein [Chitinivorax tropicus]